MLKEEILFSVILWGMLWFTVGDRIPIPLFGPRPESLREPDNYRMHKRLIRVILQKLTKSLDIYVASYFEKLRVCMNGIKSNYIL